MTKAIKADTVRLSPLLILAAALSGCHVAPEPTSSPHAEIAKVGFSLDNLSPEGLRGPPDGLRSVAYEFCVPADNAVYQQVLRIDPGLQIYPGSPGRIGCTRNQSLCIGETNQPDWHEVLQKLAALSYISEIRESFFE